MRYAVGRMAQALVVVIVVTFFTYWMLARLPGDPCITTGGLMDEAELDECHERLQLDEPVVDRYLNWAGDTLSGDLGVSYANNVPVSTSLGQRLPTTLSLFVYSQIIALVVAIPLGTWAAYKRNTVIDRLVGAQAFALLSVPAFVAGALLRYVFSVKWDLYSLRGFVGPTESITGHLKSIWLPAVVLGLVVSPVYLRLLRSDMIQNLQQDYVLVAKAKGLPPWRILLRHVLRPSTLTLMTVAGLNVAQLVNGAIVVEFLFDLDGMGSLLIEKLQQREFLVVQTMVALVAVLFVVVNLVIDVLYGIVDPRVRVDRGTS